jgi:hypothetical protein
MEISIQEIIGKIGEATAIKKLTKMDFKICRADLINTVGHSLMLNDTLSEFDCANLYLLSYLCADYFRCVVKSQPCLNASAQFFALNMHHSSFIAYPNTGDNRFRYHCARSMSHVAILDKCGNACALKVCPIKSYLTIDHYVQVFPTLNRMLTTEEGLNGYKRQIEELTRVLGEEPAIKKCDKYLDRDYVLNPFDTNKYDLNDSAQLKEYLKSSSRQGRQGHPGRIDLFGYKDTQYYCLEVKTNSSKLSLWQVIRLNWMKEHGFAAAIVRVSLKYQDKNHLLEMYNSSASKMEELLEILNPTISIEEFELSNYPKFHNFIPSTNEVAFYNCRWLSYEMDIKAIYEKRATKNAYAENKSQKCGS